MSLRRVFTKELQKCFDGSVPNKVLVALSGGVDSMCLTHLLVDYKRNHQRSLEIHALTIDHGYRDHSSQEAREVGKLVSLWGVKHHIKQLSYSRDVATITNFEEVARTLRYKAFQESCYALDVYNILVAHTLDDQLETFLQRLQMKSTIYGLNGLRRVSQLPMRPIGPVEVIIPPRVHRPLLSCTKADLISHCRAEGVQWFEDATNADPSVTKRNWLRHLVHEYIPQNAHSDNALLQIEELRKSIEAIDQARDSLEAHVKSLDRQIKKSCEFMLDESEGVISFRVLPFYWKSLDNRVAGRWLYHTMFPLSSSSNYHWSYAKIERLAMPRIAEFFNSEKEWKLALTYLNVKMDFRKLKDGSVSIRLSRQPLPREQKQNQNLVLQLSNDPSPWHLFHNIWWLRFSDQSSRKVRIETYHPSMRQDVSMAFPKSRKVTSDIPVVIDEATGSILSLPTLGLCKPELNIEWYLKKLS